MKIAVIGGTGTVGRYIMARLHALGHETASISRATGVDVVAGTGLDAALAGVQRIIDASNAGTTDEAQACAFFEKAATNMQQAGLRAGVGHITVLSIVGIDQFPSGYYVAKRAQEAAIQAGSVPVQIMRATQFHEFAGQSLDWGRAGDICSISETRVQPIAAATVAAALAKVASVEYPPTGMAEIAGPQPEALVDMVRRLAQRRGDTVQIIQVRDPGQMGDLLANGALLPSPGAQLLGPTFQEWLDADEGKNLT